MKVLLVDDSTAIQRSFGALLATAPGVEVVGYADDLATAMTAIISSQPELIVLDAKVPAAGLSTFTVDGGAGFDVAVVRNAFPGTAVHVTLGVFDGMRPKISDS